MRFVTDEKSKQEYKKFLETNERCNFQQSLEWAEVKKPNWKPEVILAEDENKNIIGSLCVWIRKMPIFGNMMYASRGPVCDIHDIKVMKQLTDGAKELAKKYHAMVLKIEPDIKSDDKEFREIVTNKVEIPQIKLYFTTDLRQNEETLANTLVEFKLVDGKYKMENVELKLIG